MSQCYGALGGTVFLQLMTDATGLQVNFLLKHPNGTLIEVFKMKDNKVITKLPFRNRHEFFFNNGTLRINHTERSDSSEYRLKTFDQHGKDTGTTHIQLFIEGQLQHYLKDVLSKPAVPQHFIQCFLCHYRPKVRC